MSYTTIQEVAQQAARRQVMKDGVRWCSNILAELLSNHGEAVLGDRPSRDCLRKAILLLNQIEVDP